MEENNQKFDPKKEASSLNDKLIKMIFEPMKEDTPKKSKAEALVKDASWTTSDIPAERVVEIGIALEACRLSREEVIDQAMKRMAEVTSNDIGIGYYAYSKFIEILTSLKEKGE